MKQSGKMDVKKFLKLFNAENVFSNKDSDDRYLELQSAVQDKLIQIARYKAGLPVEGFGVYSNGHFHFECEVPRTLYDYVSNEECRFQYHINWLSEDMDSYYNEIFSTEIAELLYFVFGYGILNENGVIDKGISLETTMEQIRRDQEEDIDKFQEKKHEIADFAKQMDFYFSRRCGPITKEVALYVDNLYCFSGGLLKREEIGEYHYIFYFLYDCGFERQFTIVASEDVAKYYAYRCMIQDSDIRKEIAEKAVSAFTNPLSGPLDEQGLYAMLLNIKRPESCVVVYVFLAYDLYAGDIEKFGLHPFYYEALQVVENLLPVLEKEYAVNKC